jgi:sugar lactone lactonase YvrE
MVEFEVSYMTRISLREKYRSKTRCLLGEGIDLHNDSGKLAWVDIELGKVIVSDLQMSEEKIYEDFMFPTKTFFDKAGALYVLHQQGISRLHIEDNTFKIESKWPWAMDGFRFNDATRIDEKTYCVSTMSTKSISGAGAVWLWSKDEKPNKIVSHLDIPNSIVYDIMLDRLYYCDSKTKAISFISLNLGNLDLNPCLFSSTGVGEPDGSTIDETGNLWNCRWDGESILIFDTSGNQKESIQLPTIRPTSCKLSTNGNYLIVTSASFDASPVDGHTLVYEILYSS